MKLVCSVCGSTNKSPQNKCRPCWANYMKKYTAENREKIRLYNKNHKKTKSYKNSCLKYDFGITLDEYSNMLNQQGGVCAICKVSETEVTKQGIIKALAVDHCHTTKKIRGLLCSKCNKGIGMFKDNTELLKVAISYLER